MAAVIEPYEVRFDSGGDEIGGVLSEAKREDAGPALVLLPDVRGVYDHFRELAGRFASEGFTTLALDLYSREGTPDLPDFEAIMRWMRALPDRRVLGDVAAAVAYLGSRADVDENAVGITGYCMGGQYALMSACSVDGLAACVSWYGMLRYAETDETKPESPLSMVPRLGCPYLGLFGEDDELIPQSDVTELRGLLDAVAQPTQVRSYAGAGHAFFNDSRPEMYREEAAADAWPRAIAFFREHLNAANA